jgi:hypothetical protein
MKHSKSTETLDLSELRDSLPMFTLGGNKGFSKKGNICFGFQGFNEGTGRASDFIPLPQFLKNIETLIENGYDAEDIIVRGGIVVNITGDAPAPPPVKAKKVVRGKEGKLTSDDSAEDLAEYQAFKKFQEMKNRGK